MRTKSIINLLNLMFITGTLIPCSQNKTASKAAVKEISEQKIILTPKTGAEPRINGAKVFGVRPGSPFLVTIPATGERPMKYEVINLPAGLKCDPNTGHISGSIDKPGNYLTTIRVTNNSGKAGREFKIVCGENLAFTPHMGWNSWYVWENHVTDK